MIDMAKFELTGCIGEILSYQDLRDSQKSGTEKAMQHPAALGSQQLTTIPMWIEHWPRQRGYNR
jgi:hypothetical protein